MKKVFLIILVLIAVYAVYPSIKKHIKYSTMKFEVVEDTTEARTYRIVSPTEVVTNLSGTSNGWTGCKSTTIDWGDHTDTSVPINSECSILLKHTYQTPGTYTIRGTIYSIASNDGPGPALWERSITVVVK